MAKEGLLKLIGLTGFVFLLMISSLGECQKKKFEVS